VDGASLLIVTGPPGAGKSTVATLVADRFEPSVLVDGDAFFGFLRRGAQPPWLPGTDRQNEVVTEAAGVATGRFVTGGYTAVYDGIVGPWYLPTFAAATGLRDVHYALLLPPVETCLARVAGRCDHGFTDEAATRHMHKGFAAAAAGIDSRHVLAEGEEGPDAVADRIVAAHALGGLAWS
jgi:hypothetical protein